MAEANQAYLSDNSPAMLVLEGIVDRVGLRNVLYALEHICHAKAQHLEANWQDEASAKVWWRNGTICGKTACKVHVEYDTSIIPVQQ
jgi:hypothetical protein